MLDKRGLLSEIIFLKAALQNVVDLGAYDKLLFPCVDILKVAADQHFDSELNAFFVQFCHFWHYDVVALQYLF